jgi:hypothetical protein
MNDHEIPGSARGRTFRKLLAVFYVFSIAGITLTLRELLGRLTAVGFDPARMQASFLGLTAALLAGWGLIGWAAYRGSRHSHAPPAWAYAAIVVLSWGAILLNRLG